MKELRPLEGFPLDLRSPGVDEVALSYAIDQFGQVAIDNVMATHHRSEASSERMYTDVMGYDRVFRNSKVRSEASYQMAVESVRKQLIPAEKLVPLTLGAAEQHPNFPQDRSPGLPWTLRGYKKKRDCLQDPVARKSWHNKWDRIGRGKVENLPDVSLFFRAQIAKVGEHKIRSVWGYPIDVMVEESRFFYPYLEWLKNAEHNVPIAYQVEMATGGMAYIQQIIDKHRGTTFLVGDWSKFDKTIPPWLIKTAFQILAEAFRYDRVVDSEGKEWPVAAVQSRRRYQRLVRYFIRTPVRLPNGTRFRKEGGVPSGSMFTNLVDSIVNMIVCRYLLYEVTGFYPSGEIYLGDDSFCACEGTVNLDDIATLADEKFGMILNTNKSYVTTKPYNVHFLGYYCIEGRPMKPQDFLIASFIYPERVVKTNEVRVSRALGQMWSTMDRARARPWFGIVERMMIDFGIDRDTMMSYIHSHPGQFKYLRILGITNQMIRLPVCSAEGDVPEVDPPSVPRRDYRPEKFDLDALMYQVHIRTMKKSEFEEEDSDADSGFDDMSTTSDDDKG
uniref:RNA-dependent RNA polymerase n=1 Tax=Crocidura shantungensis ribovirus 7 TaxID=3139542 RepID=A0AB38ZK80_9VIRU